MIRPPSNMIIGPTRIISVAPELLTIICLKDHRLTLILKKKESQPPVPGKGAGSTTGGLVAKCCPPHSTGKGSGGHH